MPISIQKTPSFPCKPMSAGLAMDRSTHCSPKPGGEGKEVSEYKGDKDPLQPGTWYAKTVAPESK
jgi:hypothetical protein